MGDDQAATSAPPPLRVLGVRHHGPGSARAVQRALAEYQPDCVLIEGPPEADELVDWVGHPEMDPPVALLAWVADEPARSSFWPFAVFSPEWQALVWAQAAGAEVRFIDLPAGQLLAAAADEAAPVGEPEDEPEPEPEDELDEEAADQLTRTDPIALLAAAAGYDDPEAWWEDVIELPVPGHPAPDPFDQITEAMAELRIDRPETNQLTLVREAQFRRGLRAAQRDGYQRIAVVCGAWHAPALVGRLPTIAADNELLKGQPKIKTEITWVPWTHSRLSMRSGYGAGVESPGWYHYLFENEAEPTTKWLTQVAGVLRQLDLPVSTAHIIEAVRLADGLAALRGRPVPGLSEVQEATWSVLCEGNLLAAKMVTRDAVVGERLGRVPTGVPTVPLDTDLRATAKRLRLKFEATVRDLVLDLRKPTDLARSQLLQRLRILRVPWGVPQVTSSTGTFKEGWQLQWDPTLQVRVIDAARYGTTVAAAAADALLARAQTLAEVTAAVEEALGADLGAALDPLLARLDDLAAAEADIGQLLRTLPPLARSQRYGDVRRTETQHLALVTAQVLARACAGLPAAASGLAPEAAATLRAELDGVQAAIGLLTEADQQLWRETLATLADRESVAGIIAGRVVRIMLDGGQFDGPPAAARLSAALSYGTAPDEQANWIDGFLDGNPLLLVHDPTLLGIIDEWVRRIDDETFTDVLPVVRRAFGRWDAAARRQLASSVRRLGTRTAAASAAEPEFDADDAPLLATLSLFLGGGQS